MKSLPVVLASLLLAPSALYAFDAKDAELDDVRHFCKTNNFAMVEEIIDLKPYLLESFEDAEAKEEAHNEQCGLNRSCECLFPETLLEFAVRKKCSPEMVELLIKKGAKINNPRTCEHRNDQLLRYDDMPTPQFIIYGLGDVNTRYLAELDQRKSQLLPMIKMLMKHNVDPQYMFRDSVKDMIRALHMSEWNLEDQLKSSEQENDKETAFLVGSALDTVKKIIDILKQ